MIIKKSDFVWAKIIVRASCHKIPSTNGRVVNTSHTSTAPSILPLPCTNNTTTTISHLYNPVNTTPTVH